jgi:hypothetical protein
MNQAKAVLGADRPPLGASASSGGSEPHEMGSVGARIALFDLDHTLLPIDSDHAWGEFTIGLGWVDAADYKHRNDGFYAQYQAGTLDIHAYIRFATAAVCRQGAANSIAAHEDFMRAVVMNAIKPQALELVHAHQRAGDRVVIVTATNEFVTRPIAHRPQAGGRARRERGADPAAAGFEAYIVVGGAVRDLLVGCAPKTSTWPPTPRPSRSRACSAAPSSSGGAFASCTWCMAGARARGDRGLDLPRLHGQRRRRASGRQRKTSKGELAGMKHAVDSTGRVLRDNVWGPQDEDATRRDFTINAMYYDPQTQIVVDYHGGIKDAKKRHLLRMIGDPATRYREDPVRIIRAVRFAAKLSPLGFKLDAKTAAPWCQVAGLLADVPQSRMFDEMLKLLQTGHALATIEQLKAWAWRAAFTRCWTWWWSAPTSPL